MKKGRVISFKTCNNLMRFFTQNTYLIIFCLVFITGLLFGVIFYGKSDFLNKFLNNYISEYISFRTDNKLIDVLIKSFFTSLFFWNIIIRNNFYSTVTLFYSLYFWRNVSFALC